MAQINRIQRQRLAYLMQLEIDANGLLSPAERQELLTLQRLAGIALDAPMYLVKQWAGITPDTPQRSMSASPRQRQVELLGMRWPRRPLTGRQAAVEIRRQSLMPGLTPRQRELWRVRESWT